MRVSLAFRQRTTDSETSYPLSLLFADDTGVILGAVAGSDVVKPIHPSPTTLFAPRSAALGGLSGPLFVSDTGHHRVLAWNRLPTADATPADLIIGQPDFDGEGRNGNCSVGAASLNVPTGIALGDDILAVADAWNHRVLLWQGIPRSSNRPADVVLGQDDFHSGQANRSLAAPKADTLNWCYGVTIADGRLFVADTGNRRVLVWNRVPERNGTPADLVLGQSDFLSRDDGGGGPPEAHGMRWPHAIALAGGRLFIADAGTSRIMIWNRLPQSNGAPCDIILGQADLYGIDHNRGVYEPTAATLNMPYGIAAAWDRLVVADTANSRLVGFPLASLATGLQADRLAGQRSFSGKGENRWQAQARDSLCWPYGVTTCGGLAVIADSGNNRVTVRRMAP